MSVAIVLLIVGLIFLIGGGELMVRGSIGIALKFKISALVVGMTVVAFGTSMPELLVSLNAVLADLHDISTGNVIGSNICNIGLVLGLTALVFPIAINKNSIRIDWPMMMTASIVLYLFMRDLLLIWWEGLIFVFTLIIFGTWLIRKSRKEGLQDASEEDEAMKKSSKLPLWLSMLFVLAGILALFFGSDWFVQGATDIARLLNVSERVIGLSLVALGTSIPEIITSLVAAFRKETDISIGNILGSNIFNILGILGITSIVKPIQINPDILYVDTWWMLGLAFIILPIMLLRKKMGRVEGFILLTIYSSYIYLLSQ